MPSAECPRCGAAVPDDARFCPACGLPLADDPTTTQPLPPDQTTAAPATYDVATPRYFGVTPPTVLFALATAALAIAIALAILGNWVAAIVLALVSLALLGLFVAAARRKPDTAVARGSARTANRLRERTTWVAESLTIRSGARRGVARLRSELLQDAGRRSKLLGELGEAVYAGDDEARQRVTEQLERLDEGTRAKEEEMQAIIQHAHERLEGGRRSVQPTLIDPPQPAPVPEPTPPPDEGTPPTPAPVPEPGPPPDEATPPQPPQVPEPGPQEQ
jgi:membrane protein implicated in regulation of membrane protease activity